jgi:hypothetical protein
MGMGFTARSCPRADNPDTILAGVGMGDEQETLRIRHPKRDEPTLVVGMIGIVERLGERVEEDGLRFLEGDIMLAEILRSFPDVPLVNHAPIVPPTVRRAGVRRARLSRDHARRLQRLTTVKRLNPADTVRVPSPAFWDEESWLTFAFSRGRS